MPAFTFTLLCRRLLPLMDHEGAHANIVTTVISFFEPTAGRDPCRESGEEWPVGCFDPTSIGEPNQCWRENTATPIDGLVLATPFR